MTQLCARVEPRPRGAQARERHYAGNGTHVHDCVRAIGYARTGKRGWSVWTSPCGAHPTSNSAPGGMVPGTAADGSTNDLSRSRGASAVRTACRLACMRGLLAGTARRGSFGGIMAACSRQADEIGRGRAITCDVDAVDARRVPGRRADLELAAHGRVDELVVGRRGTDPLDVRGGDGEVNAPVGRGARRQRGRDGVCDKAHAVDLALLAARRHPGKCARHWVAEGSAFWPSEDSSVGDSCRGGARG